MIKTTRSFAALFFALFLLFSLAMLPGTAQGKEILPETADPVITINMPGNMSDDLSDILPGNGNVRGGNTAGGQTENGNNNAKGENGMNGGGTEEERENHDYNADENGKVAGVTDERGSAWSVVWGIVIALLIAAAVVAGVVLLVPSKNEN